MIDAGGDPSLYVPQLHAVRLPLEIERYRSVLLGKIDFVLSIEPENRFFREAKNRLVFRNCEDETE